MANSEDAYDKTASTLQNITLIFIAFLLFITFFIFNPYTSLTTNYKLLQDLLIYSDGVNQTLKSITPIIKEYPDWIKAQDDIESSSRVYKTMLNKTYGNISNFSTLEEKLKNDARVYSICTVLRDKIQPWIGCNELQYKNALKDKTIITINSSVSNYILTNISTIQKDLEKIKETNDKTKPKLIPDTIFSKVILNITRWTNELRSNTNSENKLQMNYSYLDKFINIGMPYIPSLRDPSEKIENQIKIFNKRLEDLTLPLVGKAPFNVEEMLLSFPIIISLGFSFISILFKKLMELHKKSRFTQDHILSWLDPLQNFPEKLYSWLIIAIPGASYIIFNLIIFDPTSANIQFLQTQNPTQDFLITQETRTTLYILDVISLVTLFFSYFQIIWSWRRFRGHDSILIRHSTSSSPLRNLMN